MMHRIFSKKRLIKTIIVILLLVVSALLIRWMLSPHKGKVTLSSSSPDSKVLTTYTDKLLDGTDIAFNYSGKYIAKNEGQSNNDLEVYRLSADTHYDKQILASVSNLPDGQLSYYAAYKYRQLHTELYTLRKVRVDNIAVDVWVKNDGTEQTAMIPKGNKVATIALTTASTTDQLTPEIDALLSTFRWKQ